MNVPCFLVVMIPISCLELCSSPDDHLLEGNLLYAAGKMPPLARRCDSADEIP